MKQEGIFKIVNTCFHSLAISSCHGACFPPTESMVFMGRADIAWNKEGS